MAEIWKHNLSYRLLRPVVDICVYRSFRRVSIVGRENIPKDGSLLIAPNHCNALMDALDILLLFRGPVMFGSRADIFKSPAAAAVLRWLKIIPIPRERDGMDALKSGMGSVHEASEILSHGYPFCLYSEGTHRTKHSLLRIRKGIFRVALEAVRNTEGPVYILPVGLEYGDYYRYRGTLLMNVGRAMEVRAILSEHPDAGEAEIYRLLSEELRRRLSSLIICLKDDERYEDNWTLVRFLLAGYQGSLAGRLKAAQGLVSGVEEASERFPREMKALVYKTTELSNLRRRRKVSYLSFGRGRSAWRIFGGLLQWLIALPYFLWSALVSLPVWLTAEIISSRLADRAFKNSIRCCVRLVGMPLMNLIWVVLAFCFLPAVPALAAVLLSLPSCSVFYDFSDLTRIVFSDIVYALHPEMERLHKEILRRYKVISM